MSNLCAPRRMRLWALTPVLALIASGCSPAGTGSVSVKDRGKIQEKLEKGAKTTDASGKPLKTDDMGVKFRGKGKGD